MSRENVELAHRALEALFRKPKPDFDTVNALYHPDHEFISLIESLEGGVRRGVSGYREWLRDMGDTFEWESKVERVTAIDDDRVLAITPSRFHGKQSGVALDERTGCILTLRDGKIVRTELYPTPKEALEAVRR